MEKFESLTAVAAPLIQINIDTDAIIPSREMKRVSKEGLGEGLFAGWRYTLPGGREPNPEFVLNKSEYANTQIILSGDNFGCGSSREHAVWALKDYGIRAVVAPSFGSIFYHNCIRNGILPVVIPAENIAALAQRVEQQPQDNKLTIDLVEQTIGSADAELKFEFSIEPGDREMLLEGLDAVALTLTREADIATFEQRDRARRPWLYL